MEVRQVLIICLIILSSSGSAQQLDLNKIRVDFSRAVKEEELCKDHLESLRKSANTVTEQGYLAVYEMILAKHVSNPFKKMSHFKAGKNKLEKLIQKDKSNVELRFIRLSIQAHIPSYLGYSGNIQEDKKYLCDNLYKMNDEKTQLLVYNYMKGANIFTEDELKKLGR